MVTKHQAPPTHWCCCENVRRLPRWQPPGSAGSAVVVSPHPDDETLGAGGLIQRLLRLGWRTTLVQVTRGERGGGTASTTLARTRESEQRRALHRLRASAMPVRHLGLPDTLVEKHESELAALLAPVLATADLVAFPHPLDGHRDHEATGRACLAAAPGDIRALAYMVWLPEWHEPSTTRVAWSDVRQLRLTPTESRRKNRAMACYRSQVGSVVPFTMLATHRRPYELVQGGWR